MLVFAVDRRGKCLLKPQSPRCLNCSGAVTVCSVGNLCVAVSEKFEEADWWSAGGGGKAEGRENMRDARRRAPPGESVLPVAAMIGLQLLTPAVDGIDVAKFGRLTMMSTARHWSENVHRARLWRGRQRQLAAYRHGGLCSTYTPRQAGAHRPIHCTLVHNNPTLGKLIIFRLEHSFPLP